MSRKRISGAQLVVLALGGAGGCSAYPTLKPAAPADCTVENAYTFEPSPPDLTATYSSADPTPGAVFTAGVETIPDPPCGLTTALVLRASRNNDWGGLAGFYAFGKGTTLYRDESEFEGVSFWGRAPGNSSKSFTMVLDDFNTTNPTPVPPGDGGVDPDLTDSNCIEIVQPDGGQTVTIIDPATGMVLSSGTTMVTAANACGNSYNAVLTLANDWQLYTIPFTRFHQTNSPNRVPNDALKEAGPVPGTGLLINKLMRMLFRPPKATPSELWFGKLGFYRKQAPGAGGDGGVVDASRF